MYYVTFNTTAGWIGAGASSKGCLRTTFPQKSGEAARMALGESFSFASYSLAPFSELVDQYRTYFKGGKTSFTAGLDLSQASPFELKVWTVARQIPFGATWSYAQVARHIGNPKAARAVGQALGRNPLPIIIPCHRVLASDGRLGGFGGGLEMKRFLLELESARKPGTS